MVALRAAPKGPKPLLTGDLNSDLDFPRDRQEEFWRRIWRSGA